MIFGPAICVFEISSLALGYTLIDKAVKKAPVKILEGSALTPGKFFILLNGDEASIDEARNEILTCARSASGSILDEVFIPQLHADILPAAYAQIQQAVTESLGLIETSTIASGFISADAVAKSSDVKLIDLRLARGIGGKSLYFFTGPLQDVQAGVETAQSILSDRGTLLRAEVIARPHEDFLQHFFNLPTGQEKNL